MARILQLEEDWVEYLPEIDGNRGDKDPVSMEIRPINVVDFRSYQRTISAGPKGDVIDRAHRIVDRILADRVRNIKNYAYRVPITTGELLAKFGEQEMVDDVYGALMNISKLRAGIKKKSGSQSDSPDQGISHAGNGPAQSAKAIPAAMKSVASETATATQTQT